MEHDEDHRDHFNYSAGDSLNNIATAMHGLRDALMEFEREIPIDQNALEYFAEVELTVAEHLVANAWAENQNTFKRATERELEEMDTTWVDEQVPVAFWNREEKRAITPAEYTALKVKLKQKSQLRVATNPATRRDL